MGDLGFTCDKCPRTFKLQEFYDKHKLVHDLKKQHVCHLCGSVYGAAKGLEGHLKTHKHEEEARDAGTKAPDAETPCDVTFLNARGVLADATPAENRDRRTDPPGPSGPAKNGTGSYAVFGKKIREPKVGDVSSLFSSFSEGLSESVETGGTAVQNESGFFTCKICTREFSGLNSLKKHVPIHARKVQVSRQTAFSSLKVGP